MAESEHESRPKTKSTWVKPGSSRFLVVFKAYTLEGEWVTAEELTDRILHSGYNHPDRIAALRRAIAQKLSNLNRFGHLDRRRNGVVFEYSLPVPKERSNSPEPG